MSSMNPQEISVVVAAEKYAKNDEASLSDIRVRVAKALAVNEPQHEEAFLSSLERGFIPGGRISSAAGTGIGATLINCFVQPIYDSATEDEPRKPSIYTALKQAAETMRRGGGVGYDFSRLRPKNSMVKGTQSRASGPVSFLPLFDASCATVESAGARRGAQMGVLRCDHPDIELFIHAKDAGTLKNFNLSVAVTDKFMLAVETDDTFELVHEKAPAVCEENSGCYQREDGKWIYRVVRARDLWKQIMMSTYDHAEPGILFLDRINAENNLYYCEVIEAVNPCAEQALGPYACCDLGSLNLTAYVVNPFTDEVTFDWAAFEVDIQQGVRMLDNVLDLTLWPLEEQKNEAHSKRRIGVGFLGLGSALIMMKLKYNSQEGLDFAAKMTEFMRDTAYMASIELAKEKGAFPAFDAEKYLAGAFIQRLPETIRQAIAEHGIRNSHLLSIAPTGTITLAFADNASNGIEPAFSWTYDRKKRQDDGTTKVYEVADHAYRMYRSLGHDVSRLPEYFVSAMDMSAIEHMQMLEVVQPFIDAAISKTVNVPADYPYDQFENLYMAGWKAGLKGLATYRPNSTLGSVLSVKEAPAEPVANAEKPQGISVDVDPLYKRIPGRREGRMEAINEKAVLRGAKGKYTFYSGVSFDTVTGVIDGKEVAIRRPMETFFPANQISQGQQWVTFLMMSISSLMRAGGDVAGLLQNARAIAWEFGQVTCGYLEKDDGSKVPLRHNSEAAVLAYLIQRTLTEEGFLDASGNQVPVKALVAQFEKSGTANLDDSDAEEALFQAASGNAQGEVSFGKYCSECGAHAVVKRDGCEVCTACNAVGSCG